MKLRYLSILLLYTITPAQTVVNGSRVFLGNLDASGSQQVRIKTGTGIPASSSCQSAAAVGSLYARDDANASNATLYVCSRTGAGYSWELAQSAASAAQDPFTEPPLVAEEFVSGTVTSGSLGALGWSNAAVSSGAVGMSSETGAWGIVTLLSDPSGTVGSGRTLYIPSTAAGRVDNTVWKMQWRLRANTTGNVQLHAGWSYSASALAIPRGVYVRFDSTTDTTWMYCLRDTSAANCVSSGVAPDTGYHDFTMERTSAGVVSFRIDGAAQKTFCASGCDASLANMTPDSMMVFASGGVAGSAGTQSGLRIDRFLLRTQ